MIDLRTAQKAEQIDSTEELKAYDMLRQLADINSIKVNAGNHLYIRFILQKLWHSNIYPQTDSLNNSPEMKQLMEYIARHHDDLFKTMTDEQKETFEKFHDCWSEYISLAEAAIFEYAFRLGARLAMGTLQDNE